jgi:sialate O-acetylesterase
VLWYQGESDAMHPQEYKGMLVKMIDLWRHKFVYGSKELPFVIVQLPNWSDGWNEDSVSKDGGWAVTRQVQADAAEIAGHAGLVVSIDAGEWNDLHPEKKKTIGYRAAKEALRVAYGKNFISPSPKADICEFKKGRFLVHFDCGNSSLVACKVEGNKADLNLESKDKKVYGFSLLCSKKGEESVIPASAELIDDKTVSVDVPHGVGDVKELRYLWADSPAPVNLYSRNSLPAAPFRIIQG